MRARLPSSVADADETDAATRVCESDEYRRDFAVDLLLILDLVVLAPRQEAPRVFAYRHASASSRGARARQAVCHRRRRVADLGACIGDPLRDPSATPGGWRRRVCPSRSELRRTAWRGARCTPGRTYPGGGGAVEGRRRRHRCSSWSWCRPTRARRPPGTRSDLAPRRWSSARLRARDGATDCPRRLRRSVGVLCVKTRSATAGVSPAPRMNREVLPHPPERSLDSSGPCSLQGC